MFTLDLSNPHGQLSIVVRHNITNADTALSLLEESFCDRKVKDFVICEDASRVFLMIWTA